MSDIWKRVSGFNNYVINNKGVVKNLNTSKELKSYIRSDGYRQIRLCKSGKPYCRYVHRLVWEAFMGEIPEGMLVLHGVGNDKSNCHLEYLSLGTIEDNLGRDRKRDGTLMTGEKNCQTTLSIAQVKYIRERSDDGMLQKHLAYLFNVSRVTIYNIVYRRTWAHV